MLKTAKRSTRRSGHLCAVLAETDVLPKEVRDAALAETLLGTFAEPEDVAATVAFLKLV